MRLATYGRSTLGVWPSPVVAAIRARRPFTTSGALRATSGAEGGSGRLSGDGLDQWRDDVGRGDVRYVVWSYATPIAWWSAPTTLAYGRCGCWRFPEDRYSVTTTRHQGMVRLALSL